MNSVFVALSVAALIGGIFAIVVGARRREPIGGECVDGALAAAGGPGGGMAGREQPRAEHTLGSRILTRWRRASRRDKTIVVVAGLAALVGYLLTQSLLVALGLPALIVLLPRLLAAPANREVAVLEACDRWVRLLIGSVSTGKSVPDAIRATRGQVVPIMREPVQGLIDHLDARWTTEASLRAMADELASPDADAILAALIVSTRRGGTGTSDALRALGQHSKRRLQALREIEAERAKPRIVVRQVTVITVVVLVGVTVFNPDYVSPYLSTSGGLIGGLLLACYLGSLMMLQRMARATPPARILQTHVSERMSEPSDSEPAADSRSASSGALVAREVSHE